MQLLTASEEVVMKSVWELGGNCTLSQIVTRAKEHGKIWQLQTVATFLKHLEGKGYVRPYKDGRFLHYEIIIGEEKYKQYVFRKFLGFWWGGKMENLVRDMKEEGLVSQEEFQRFRETFEAGLK